MIVEMDTKLTLNVDKQIIKLAKEYAKSQKVSLSQLIESYLNAIVVRNFKENEITPLVRSLSGVIKIEDNYDYKESYKDFLIQKYK